MVTCDGGVNLAGRPLLCAVRIEECIISCQQGKHPSKVVKCLEINCKGEEVGFQPSLGIRLHHYIRSSFFSLTQFQVFHPILSSFASSQDLTR